MRDRTQETITMIQGICFGIMLMAFLVAFYTLPRTKREACRDGVEYMLKIGNATNTDTKEIGTDAYMSDTQIDSILEASE